MADDATSTDATTAPPDASDAEPDDATAGTDEGAGGPEAGATSDGGAPGDPGSGRGADGFDLRGIVKQFTAPMIESLDSRLREQVEAHADSVLDAKIDAALADRLATIERAVADLSRSISGLERRVEGLERSGAPPELEE
jgi:hypothetical protein